MYFLLQVSVRIKRRGRLGGPMVMTQPFTAKGLGSVPRNQDPASHLVQPKK